MKRQQNETFPRNERGRDVNVAELHYRNTVVRSSRKI